MKEESLRLGIGCLYSGLFKFKYLPSGEAAFLLYRKNCFRRFLPTFDFNTLNILLNGTVFTDQLVIISKHFYTPCADQVVFPFSVKASPD